MRVILLLKLSPPTHTSVTDVKVVRGTLRPGTLNGTHLSVITFGGITPCTSVLRVISLTPPVNT